MADWTLIGGANDTRAVGLTAGTTRGTLVTAGAANTKGAYAQLTASSPIDCDAFIVTVQEISGADCLIDIAVGGAGSEQIICANLHHINGTFESGLNYFVPIPIPIATRIAARSQTIPGASVQALGVHLIKGGHIYPSPMGRMTTYGANTADSGGVSIDPGAAANTKGAYSEITSSTTNPIKGFILAVGTAGNVALSTGNWFVDVAVGGAGSEVVILPDWYLRSTASADGILPAVSPIFPIEIPASTRIAVRAQSTITDATDRLFDAFIYGLD